MAGHPLVSTFSRCRLIRNSVLIGETCIELSSVASVSLDNFPIISVNCVEQEINAMSRELVSSPWKYGGVPAPDPWFWAVSQVLALALMLLLLHPEK